MASLIRYIFFAVVALVVIIGALIAWVWTKSKQQKISKKPVPKNEPPPPDVDSSQTNIEEEEEEEEEEEYKPLYKKPVTPEYQKTPPIHKKPITTQYQQSPADTGKETVKDAAERIRKQEELNQKLLEIQRQQLQNQLAQEQERLNLKKKMAEVKRKTDEEKQKTLQNQAFDALRVMFSNEVITDSEIREKLESTGYSREKTVPLLNDLVTKKTKSTEPAGLQNLKRNFPKIPSDTIKQYWNQSMQNYDEAVKLLRENEGLQRVAEIKDLKSALKNLEDYQKLEETDFSEAYDEFGNAVDAELVLRLKLIYPDKELQFIMDEYKKAGKKFEQAKVNIGGEKENPELERPESDIEEESSEESFDKKEPEQEPETQEIENPFPKLLNKFIEITDPDEQLKLIKENLNPSTADYHEIQNFVSFMLQQPDLKSSDMLLTLYNTLRSMDIKYELDKQIIIMYYNLLNDTLETDEQLEKIQELEDKGDLLLSEKDLKKLLSYQDLKTQELVNQRVKIIIHRLRCYITTLWISRGYVSEYVQQSLKNSFINTVSRFYPIGDIYALNSHKEREKIIQEFNTGFKNYTEDMYKKYGDAYIWYFYDHLLRSEWEKVITPETLESKNNDDAYKKKLNQILLFSGNPPDLGDIIDNHRYDYLVQSLMNGNIIKYIQAMDQDKLKDRDYYIVNNNDSYTKNRLDALYEEYFEKVKHPDFFQTIPTVLNISENVTFRNTDHIFDQIKQIAAFQTFMDILSLYVKYYNAKKKTEVPLLNKDIPIVELFKKKFEDLQKLYPTADTKMGTQVAQLFNDDQSGYKTLGDTIKNFADVIDDKF